MEMVYPEKADGVSSTVIKIEMVFSIVGTKVRTVVSKVK
jgi:hypothetical protein